MAQISLHALNGVVDYQTLRITAHKGIKTLQVLMDTGSTHNFLDYNLALKFSCKLILRAPMSVRMGGGKHLVCEYMVQNFEWQMKGLLFIADVFLIPLGSCDLVLGVQWFSTLGKVQFDFTAHTIDFCWKGKQILLRGAVSTPLFTVDNKKMHKTLQASRELSTLQVFAMH